MKKSLLLLLTVALGSLGTPQTWSAETYSSGGSGSSCSHHGGGHGAQLSDSEDACRETYPWNPTRNPCEKVYTPRTSVDPNERSTTKGPLAEDNCNEHRSRKLIRGITNVTMAIGEIPAGAFREAYATTPVTGAVVGGAHGAVTAVKRIGIGLFEILTFPIPLNQKPTGEVYMAGADAEANVPADAHARHDHQCWGSMTGVDGCCNVTRGTFDPYMEPEIVFMDALPPAGR